jgi:hypothetical protein
LPGGGDELAGLLGRVPTGRLVVLGEPGSGKSMFTIRLVLDLLAARSPGDPVPVLVALAAWNPDEQTLQGWLEQVLIDTYPGLTTFTPGGVSRAWALLDTGQILPILDPPTSAMPRPSRPDTAGRRKPGPRPVPHVRLNIDLDVSQPPAGAPSTARASSPGCRPASSPPSPSSRPMVRTYLRKSAGLQAAAYRAAPGPPAPGSCRRTTMRMSR